MGDPRPTTNDKQGSPSNCTGVLTPMVYGQVQLIINLVALFTLLYLHTQKKPNLL